MERPLVLKNVRVHNLKGVDLELPPGELIVFTGVSGSGKSSLAFDTIYVEGQRRYIESLSAQARRELGEFPKPELDHAAGITPTISIEQKTKSLNPRSTVGTLTEVYDYLRVLYAKVGTPYCPISGKPLKAQSRDQIIHALQRRENQEKVLLLAPVLRSKKGELKDELELLKKKGFLRVQIDGQLYHLDDLLALDSKKAHDLDLVIDRITLSKENKSRIGEAVTQALEWGKGMLIVQPVDGGESELFSLSAYSEEAKTSYPPLDPQDFSFNSPKGMCPTCHGLGVVQEFDIEKVIDPEKSILEDCCEVASSAKTVRFGNIYRHLAETYDFSLKTPWKKLSAEAKKIFLFGTGKKWHRFRFVHPETGSTWVDHLRWDGVFAEAKRRYMEAKSDFYRQNIEKLFIEMTCPTCQGSRLQAYPAACRYHGLTLFELVEGSIEEGLTFFSQLKISPEEEEIAGEIIKEIKERLTFLVRVGLGYLCLNRGAPTLSGGEAQRVRLASQIGAGLVGVTYILDEPSIGLHPQDNGALIETLKTLRDRGNRVVVVEHDEETILSADHIVDVGPGPGILGGEVLVNGTLKDLLASKESITGAYFRGDRKIELPKKRRKAKKGSIDLIGVTHHNLKKVDVSFPLEKFIAVSGVSGSGKSSLLLETLFPFLSNKLQKSLLPVGKFEKIKGDNLIDKVIGIDQTPIGRNPRSNPGTYIKVLDLIRDLFASLPESKIKGYDKGRFSFNVKEGSCPGCHGMGMIRVDMDFLEEAWVECPTCEGERFDSATLAITYKGKSISDILNSEIRELLPFFENHKDIHHRLKALADVGLDYLKLGQASPTLSGGESQRVKLAKELLRPSTGKTLYILDEPTTGLHLADVDRLLKILHRLVDEGNTLIVIEHNMEFVKTADWVIELGPKGGKAGGKIIAEGTPEDLLKLKTPTGLALKPLLSGLPYPIPAKQKKEISLDVGFITIKGAEQNNLKHISLKIPRDQITVFTGPSGAGKSSLAHDTLFAEGQRRYTESLSPYARQFIAQMPKPKVEAIEGLSPAIAIEQKSGSGNLRSTIGTMTEIHDLLRVLYASLGIPYNPVTGNRLQEIRPETLLKGLEGLDEGTRLVVLAPLQVKRGDDWIAFLKGWQQGGFQRIYLNGEYYHLDDPEMPIDKIPFDPKQKQELYLVVDRLRLSESEKPRFQEAIESAAKVGRKRLALLIEDKISNYYLDFADPVTGETFPPITPKSFAFNLPEGYCPTCAGTGEDVGADLLHQEELMAMTIRQIFDLFFGKPGRVLLKALEKKVDPLSLLEDLTTREAAFLLKGGDTENIHWKGLEKGLEMLARVGPKRVKEILAPLMKHHVCPTCQGSRLNPVSRAVQLAGKTLPEITSQPLDQLPAFFETVHPPYPFLVEMIETLQKKLRFLMEIGVGYLSLDRTSTTLSGGEVQRVRLARQLGSGLTGVLYILDEPTTGLHPQDVDRLNRTLIRLKEEGNTLVIVEHDPLTMAIADHLVDFGPKGGTGGGRIIAEGSYSHLLQHPHSETALYLSGKKTLPRPTKRRKSKERFSLKKGNLYNLHHVDIDFPVGCLSVITGVSGSGKSTFLHSLLAPLATEALKRGGKYATPLGSFEGGNWDHVVLLDQNPVGMTSRSDVGTYAADLLPKIRTFFARLPEAEIRGLQPRHFSTNHPKGMCSNCFGLGYRKVDLLFLPAVKVPCDVCQGKRLNPVSLEVSYKGLDFGDILKLTVEEASHVFEVHRPIKKTLDVIKAVGLDYVKLGQEMQNLSLGESQRIKLAREIVKGGRGKSLFLLDEPTLGLHFSDVEKLLVLLHKLVDQGHTVVVIEHHLGVIESADYIVEMGPGAGASGGKIIAAGTPEQIAKSPSSVTAPYLKL
jgi:excinuclease ABC subunit A